MAGAHDDNLWFPFGQSADGAAVDIADHNNATLIERVPAELAERIIEAHNESIERLREHYQHTFDQLDRE